MCQLHITHFKQRGWLPLARGAFRRTETAQTEPNCLHSTVLWAAAAKGGDVCFPVRMGTSILSSFSRSELVPLLRHGGDLGRMLLCGLSHWLERRGPHLLPGAPVSAGQCGTGVGQTGTMIIPASLRKAPRFLTPQNIFLQDDVYMGSHAGAEGGINIRGGRRKRVAQH